MTLRENGCYIRDGKTGMGFGAWFGSLALLPKVLVVIAIVVGAFVVGASFVTSTFQAWKHFSEYLERKEKREKKKD